MIARLVVVLVALAGSASAAKVPVKQLESTECRHGTIRLPATDAIGVPTNARSWTFADYGATDITSEPLGALDPRTMYEPSPERRFTTGDGPDDTPPAQPRVVSVSLAVASGEAATRREVAMLRIIGSFERDTAIVKLTFVDALGSQTYYTTPDDLSRGEPGLQITAGALAVEVVAIDLAGNESLPASLETTASEDPGFHPACRPQPFCATAYYEGLRKEREPRRTGDTRALFACALMFAFFVVSVGAEIRRARQREEACSEPIAPGAAEEIARAVRLRSALTITAVLAVGGVLHGTGEQNAGALVALAPAMLWVLVVAAIRSLVARAALRRLDRDGVTATIRYDQLELGSSRVVLCAPRRLVERARRNALPRASL